jgi:hypothetical protein
VDYADLKDRIAEADLCLGIFGTSDKAASVIPNKVFQILAVGRPLVTRISPAIRELLEPVPGCVYLVRPGDAHALVDALRGHARDAITGRSPCHAALIDKIGREAIARQFTELISRRLGLGRA